VTATEPSLTPGGHVTVSRVLADWHETGRPDIGGHLAVHGPVPLPRRGDGAWAERFVDDVRAAGLTGRGGAGFPTARKLESIRTGHRHPLLAVNAMEGEPASQKDRALLSGVPHLVLDGADLVATAIGAREIVICVADDRDDSAQGVTSALAERPGAGLGRLAVRLERPPGRYVTGEESALVAWLAGGAAHPQFRTSKATPLTIRRRPVHVQSAETLAHVALIARHGPEWFRSAGLPDAPGTCLVTVSGPLENPGVCEVEFGTPVADILERAGINTPIGGVLVGGYGGTWIRSGLLDTPYAPGPLRAVGSAVGAGVLAAIPTSSCGIAETARVATYMANESAGQCGPCVFGLHAIAQDLVELARAEGDRQILSRLTRRLEAVDGRGACGHPDGVVRLVRSALQVFAHDVAEHARHRPCAGWNRRPILPVTPSAAVAVCQWR
jgi:NADH:ubiquinone oxidoreductase subunit F (NADH-binding)